MSHRYLFGPVTPEFADRKLRRQRQRGDCLAFDATGATDLAIGPTDTWDSVTARLPRGWQPDFIALYLPYTSIPACLWSAPLPLVGLAADWNLLWHHYRRCLPCCDLVLTDTEGIENLGREGIAHARSANLFGCEAAWLEDSTPDGPRDIDIVFVGNLSPAVQRERLAWLGRLARLSERYRVAIHTGLFGEAYRELLGRARVAFNLSIRGECNRRAFEAAAAGALLFQEAGNREVPAYFRDRHECVYYTADDLEPLLEHYLGHENERRALADAAHTRVRQYTFEALWDETVASIEREWGSLQDRAHQRFSLSEADLLQVRAGQALAGSADRGLVRDLATALAAKPGAAALSHALGLAIAQAAQGRGPRTAASLETAADYFRQTMASEPGHVVAGLNLAEILVGIERTAPAIDQARRTLAALDGTPGEPGRQAIVPNTHAGVFRPAHPSAPVWLNAEHFPPAFDAFRVEWERAAWANAGCPAAEVDAKRRLIRWRLHMLLAELTGDLAHYYEAVLARPDLPVTRAALGCALGRAGHPRQAIPHLRGAVVDNPFDCAAARALFEALGESGDLEGQRRLARERRLLANAALQVVGVETWFAQAPPIGDELVSIIILCCNELAYTRQCLESVLRDTRPPYELVLVDNGSSDGTPAYLEEIRSRSGPARVEILRNETNRGFPAGCNQALAQARGLYVAFLNNDTVVTSGWLDGLVAWAVHDWPNVGLVGAVSNYAPAPQQVPAGYVALDGLEAFAAGRRQEYAGQALQVDRLTGFCLLARRKILERVGGFDEQYGLGFFDDDDLCLRARADGFRLLLALDVYVHHFGSRTFARLGVDCRQQLQTNFERFQAKWGAERAAGYRAPNPAPVLPPPSPDSAANSISVTPSAVASAGQPRVSLCLIVKNEETNLPACLGSVADLVDEIIVVDTGSTDGTRKVAAEFGARIFDFAWVDDFAAARNESLRHATGTWVLWLDADDRLDEENRQKLRLLLASLPEDNAAYVMKCLCLPDALSGTATVVDHVRLFRNHPQLRWQYRVHEQILLSLRRVGADVCWADVVIHHAGYQDPELRRHKLTRDLRLLHLEDGEHPDDPFTLFNLGWTYQELGRPRDALPLLQRSLERSHPTDSIVRKLYALLVQCYRQMGQAGEALGTCRMGRTYCPGDAELLFEEALLLREQGDHGGAEACLVQLVQKPAESHFASVDPGLRGHKARHQLALICHEQGRPVEAKAHWQAAVIERPDYVPAWLGLGELHLAQENWLDFDQVITSLEANPRAAVEASVLRARGHLARKEFAPALRLLGEVISHAPQALWPRVILSHVLLQEGRDWGAAERALRDVLALSPDHAEARHNLAVLQREQQGAMSRPPLDQAEVA